MSYSPTLSFTLLQLGVGFCPDAYYTGTLLGFGTGLDGCGKSLPAGSDQRTVQSVASRYTD
jgi:hypothetical protein